MMTSFFPFLLLSGIFYHQSRAVMIRSDVDPCPQDISDPAICTLLPICIFDDVRGCAQKKIASPDSSSSSSRSRLYKQRRYFKDCYPTQSRARYVLLRLGVVVDVGFARRLEVGATQGPSAARVLTLIRSLVSHANTILRAQFDITLDLITFLSISDPTARDAHGHPMDYYREEFPWLYHVPRQPGQGCGSGHGDSDSGTESPQPVGVAQRLSDFDAWVNRYHPTDLGLWVLFTDCKLHSSVYQRSGISGAAYAGRVCHKELRISLVAYDPTTDQLNAAFIHELGHILGAIHTFEHPHNKDMGAGHGIMDYNGVGVGVLTSAGMVSTVNGEGVHLNGESANSSGVVDQPRNWGDQFHEMHYEEMCFTISHSRRCTALEGVCDEEELLLDRACWTEAGCPEACDVASMLGNGVCDSMCNSEACNFDNGDCTKGTKCAPQRIGDGVCDEKCNTQESNFDGGDCGCVDKNPQSCEAKVENGDCEKSDRVKLYFCREACSACDIPRPPVLLNIIHQLPRLYSRHGHGGRASSDFLHAAPVDGMDDQEVCQDDLIHGIFCGQYIAIDPKCATLPPDLRLFCKQTCALC